MGSKSSKVASRSGDPSDRASSQDNSPHRNNPNRRLANPSRRSYQRPQNDRPFPGPPPRVPGSSSAGSAARPSPAPSVASNALSRVTTASSSGASHVAPLRTRPTDSSYGPRLSFKIWNKPDNCPLTVAPPAPGDYYLHAPLIPGQTEPYKQGQGPGGVRAVYNRNDQTHFDVIQHDTKKPQTASGAHQFTMRPYVPAATRPPHR
ncbi:hypothetical protein MGG_15296 [Pyricularia oryzae 70-15]|uniref:Uncharacterized protein n=3 Tax=Pyricularia oryzae TaxID=318829 RepID=G4MSA7_PYRO7|nr:uncharacterized protein MGG_15296 [Pyricularia oryzae 70-15]EHA58365.1 hypothetical protein MGG_15296 [Pyricularia oryzae 70-15]ELQ33054.1 hypothetical protein OOU_Y34scaffold01005g80 [Pyricularia oryzae Y34]KAI7927968.1 hypothetical protein M9X92_002032 [Pyricularia oryzae]KAI7928541.1 hypothetical protein M0657_002649 [Pyricularia oryzae]